MAAGDLFQTGNWDCWQTSWIGCAKSFGGMGFRGFDQESPSGSTITIRFQDTSNGSTTFVHFGYIKIPAGVGTVEAGVRSVRESDMPDRRNAQDDDYMILEDH